MFALAILGLLMNEPLHGYEIRKQLSEILGLSGAISYGSLYPTLARLHSQGALASTSGKPYEPKFQTASKSPDIFSTGSLSGDIASSMPSPFIRKTSITNTRKSKKVYTITEKGIELFQQKLLSSFIDHADDDKAFVAHLAFLDYANNEEKNIFIENRITALNRKLSSIPSTDHQTLKLWRDVEREYIENQIKFLRQLRQEIVQTKEKHDK